VRVGVAKATGTGSGNDYRVMLDAGAHVMLDFTDVGLASTYRQPMPRVERTFAELLGHLTASGTDVNFVEIADGVYQPETSRLIASDVFRSSVDVILFAAADAMGAAAGVAHLRGLGLEVAAVSGRITRSPLALREAQSALAIPVLGVAELLDPVAASTVIGLSPEMLNAYELDAAPPWPTVQPEWEVDGPVASDDVVLAEEAISEVVDSR
jgi:hypothetical protein